MFPNKLKDLSVLVEKLKDLVTELSFFTLNIRFLIMIERKTRRLYVKNIKIQHKKNIYSRMGVYVHLLRKPNFMSITS